MESKVLPEEVEVEILLRLPVKSLLRFKCVCKNWFSIITSPHFIKRQSNTNNRNIGKLICHRRDPISKSHVISLLDYPTAEKLEDLEWPPFVDEDVEGAARFLRGYKILGPVNGIYCIFRRLIDRWVGTLTLWNPATREYKHIQPHVSFPFPSHLQNGLWNSYDKFDDNLPLGMHLGFGYDHVSNDYKVILICQWCLTHYDLDNSFHVRVYSHASDSWKTTLFLNSCGIDLAVVPPAFVELHHKYPIIRQYVDISHCLVNGAFHWPCFAPLYCQDESFYDILAFDMATEAFQLMRGPPVAKYSQIRNVWGFRESIAAVTFCWSPSHMEHYPSHIEVWTMTEYGVNDSWAILWSLSFKENVGWTSMGIINDEKLLFEDGNGQLISIGFADDDDQVIEHGIYGNKDDAVLMGHEIYGTLGILNYVETLETLKSVVQQ